MPPSGVDYASEFLNGYAPEYVQSYSFEDLIIVVDWQVCWNLWDSSIVI